MGEDGAGHGDGGVVDGVSEARVNSAGGRFRGGAIGTRRLAQPMPRGLRSPMDEYLSLSAARAETNRASAVAWTFRPILP